MPATLRALTAALLCARSEAPHPGFLARAPLDSTGATLTFAPICSEWLTYAPLGLCIGHPSTGDASFILSCDGGQQVQVTEFYDFGCTNQKSVSFVACESACPAFGGPVGYFALHLVGESRWTPFGVCTAGEDAGFSVSTVCAEEDQLVYSFLYAGTHCEGRALRIFTMERIPSAWHFRCTPGHEVPGSTTWPLARPTSCVAAADRAETLYFGVQRRHYARANGSYAPDCSATDLVATEFVPLDMCAKMGENSVYMRCGPRGTRYQGALFLNGAPADEDCVGKHWAQIHDPRFINHPPGICETACLAFSEPQPYALLDFRGPASCSGPADQRFVPLDVCFQTGDEFYQAISPAWHFAKVTCESAAAASVAIYSDSGCQDLVNTTTFHTGCNSHQPEGRPDIYGVVLVRCSQFTYDPNASCLLWEAEEDPYNASIPGLADNTTAAENASMPVVETTDATTTTATTAAAATTTTATTTAATTTTTRAATATTTTATATTKTTAATATTTTATATTTTTAAAATTTTATATTTTTAAATTTTTAATNTTTTAATTTTTATATATTTTATTTTTTAATATTTTAATTTTTATATATTTTAAATTTTTSATTTTTTAATATATATVAGSGNTDVAPTTTTAAVADNTSTPAATTTTTLLEGATPVDTAGRPRAAAGLLAAASFAAAALFA